MNNCEAYAVLICFRREGPPRRKITLYSHLGGDHLSFRGSDRLPPRLLWYTLRGSKALFFGRLGGCCAPGI